MTKEELAKLTVEQKREYCIQLYEEIVADMKEYELDEMLLDN